MKLILIALFFSTAAIAQQTSSKLTVKELDVTSRVNVTSTTKSSKPCPAMTETQRNAIATPLNGSCIYNTTTSKLNVYNGSVWKAAGGGVDNWLTATAYSVDDIVIESSKIYQCLTAHTSGTFATDLAALKWVEISSTIPVNLTGPITSVGNATSIASQTGTGSKFVMDTSPTLVTPSIGAATGTSLALGGTKAASAVLDVQSTTQGVLPPRMTTAQMNAISSPANGLTIYNTDYNSLASYNSTSAVWTYGFGNLTVATDWVPCTFSTLAWQGLGTVTNNSLQCRRQGSDLLMKGTFTTGTTSANVAQIPLPNNYGTILTQTAGLDSYGRIHRNFINSGELANLISTTGLGYMNISTGIGYTANQNTPVNGSAYANSTEAQTLEGVSIPIAGWSSNTSAWVQANSNPIATTTEFSAQVSSGGAVSLESTDWINGNANTTSPYTINFNSGIFTVTPNCVATTTGAVNANVRIESVSSSAVVVRSLNYSPSTIDGPFTIKCQRSGADYTAAHSPFIIGIPAMGMASITSIATTSGTFKDFTIPSGVKRITLSMSGVSTNGGSSFQFQLGTSAGIQTSGYDGASAYTGLASGGTNPTSGFVSFSDIASDLKHGAIVFTLVDTSTGTWAASGNFGFSARAYVQLTAGSKTLSGTLDRVRLTTVNGTDTFDAGKVNVSWEF